MEHSQVLRSNDSREIIVAETQPTSFRLAYADRWDPDPSEGGDFRGLLEYWRMLCRHKVTVLLVTLLGGLAGFLFNLYQIPIYRARTSLEIQGVQEGFLDTQRIIGAEPSNDIQTQVKLLQSQSLRGRVISKMKREDRDKAVKSNDSFSGWRGMLSLSAASAASSQELAIGMAVGSLDVLVARESRIIEIFCDSTDPDVAAEFANTLAAEYIEQSLEERWNVYQRTGEWLSRAQEDLKTKLETSEAKLQDYARSSGLLLTSEKDNVAEDKLRQLQAELSRAQADRITKQAQFGIISASPEVLDSGTLSHYQGQLADLRRQMAELGATLTPAHYKVKRLQAQIAELESIRKNEKENLVERIRNEYAVAVDREKLLAADFANQSRLITGQGEKLIEYNMLKREVDTSRQLYEATLQKGKEASLASAMRSSNARVVDPAKPPRLPYKPNVVQNSVLGLVTGLFASVVFVFFREHANRTIQGPGDMPLYLKVRELGVIPSANAMTGMRSLGRQHTRLSLRGSVNGRRSGNGGNGNVRVNGNDDRQRKEPESGECVELVTWTNKPSLVAESFRATLTSILFTGQNGNRPQIIVCTSPCPREGKSTVISNLGIALAEINRQVLLVDADLRAPRLHSIFDVSNSWGLSNLLREKNPIEESPIEALVRKTKIACLSLLPSGPGTVSISHLLYSPRMSELLSRFRREFDTVLIDAPPMLNLSDARVLGRLSDAVILVLRAGQTSRDAALAATQRFQEDGTGVLGTILNDWDPKAMGNGYYDRYYSYHQHGKY